MYKLIAEGGVQRLSDGAFVPEDERNADWREFTAWAAEGNEPYPADYVPPQATPAEAKPAPKNIKPG
jgi:hypothetical protein